LVYKTTEELQLELAELKVEQARRALQRQVKALSRQVKPSKPRRLATLAVTVASWSIAGLVALVEWLED